MDDHNPPIIRPRTDLSDAEVNKICDVIREAGFSLHKFLGPVFREKVYERGMIHRLRKAGLVVRAQPSVLIYDEDYCMATTVAFRQY